MMRVRWGSFEEFKTIYQEILPLDFNKKEAKSFQLFQSLQERGLLSTLLMEEDGKLLGYMILSESDQNDCILLEYIAMAEDQRGLGIGSKFMTQYLNGVDKPVYIEAEDPAFALNEQDRLDREKRIEFYTRLGLKVTNYSASLYGGRYRILYFDPKKEITDGENFDQQIRQLYKTVLTQDSFEKGQLSLLSEDTTVTPHGL